MAEYALRDYVKPIGIAEYQLVESLPTDLQTNLLSIETIVHVLADETGENDELNPKPARPGSPIGAP